MISKADFEAIKQEVFEAIKECLIVSTKNQARPGEDMVFIARGDYNHSVAKGYNPNTIDTREDFYKEADKQLFLIRLMDRRYSFEKRTSIDNDPEQMLVELMTYTHIWESAPFLKMLRRLACMCNSMDYEWDIKVPPMGKHKFIRIDIRDLFKQQNLKIYEVIKKGFQSQLRDAFAHSDFSFQWHKGHIWLFNYDASKSHHMQEITFDEWTKKFCYTWLLNYQLNECFFDVRQNYHLINGSTEFLIPLPDTKGGYENVTIVYTPPPHDMLQFKSKMKSQPTFQ